MISRRGLIGSASESKENWETVSQIKLDLTRITTPNFDDQNGNFRVRTAVISVDEDQKKITDFSVMLQKRKV